MSQRRRAAVSLLVASALLSSCQSATKQRSNPTATLPLHQSTTTVSTAVPSTTVVQGPLTQRAEPPLPVALQEGGAAVVAGKFYEVAGYDTSRNSTAYTFVFDGAAWHRGPDLPQALNHPGVGAIGNDVYAVGGFAGSGATSRAFVLRAGSSSWHEIATLRRARGALSLVSLGGRLYAFGGRAGSVEVAVPERYDPATNTWTDLPAMPDPRNHGAGYVDGADACIAGGRTPATSAAIDCFDSNTGAWKRTGQLQIATSGASAASFDDRLLVAGGEPSLEIRLIGVVQERRAGTWATHDMLIPRHGAAFAVYRGRLWLCGGATAPGFQAVAACTSMG